MSFTNWLRNLRSVTIPYRAQHQRRRPSPLGKASRVRPLLETLEDRTVPTVVFNPVFGAETLIPTPQNDYNFTTMANAPVNLIYWGSSWSTTAGKQLASTLGFDAQAILNSNYLNGLTQWGGAGQASYAKAWTDPSITVTGNSVPQIQAEIANAITAGGVNGPAAGATQPLAPIYVVITDPANSPGNGGYNINGTYTPSGGPAIPINMVWIGTGTFSTADIFSSDFSHEIAERMSDPTNDNNGVLVKPPANIPSNVLQGGTPQIGDFEPESSGSRYGYRLNGSGGVLVQPYWSAQDNAFIVPDGTAQTLTLFPTGPSTIR